MTGNEKENQALVENTLLLRYKPKVTIATHLKLLYEGYKFAIPQQYQYNTYDGGTIYGTPVVNSMYLGGSTGFPLSALYAAQKMTMHPLTGGKTNSSRVIRNLSIESCSYHVRQCTHVCRHWWSALLGAMAVAIWQ